MNIKYLLNKAIIWHLNSKLLDHLIWSKSNYKLNVTKFIFTYDLIENILRGYSPSNFNKTAHRLKAILKGRLAKAVSKR